MGKDFPYSELSCWMDPPGEEDKPRRIFVEGLIGAGKTKFADDLSKLVGYRLLKEPVEENPFLDLYYEDMVRYGFSMQVHLLTERLSLERAGAYMVQAGIEQGVVGDRSLGGDTVFLRANALLGNIPLPEYKLYFRLFNQMKIECPYPDLIIYLDVPLNKIRNRIAERGRECEKSILSEDNPYLATIEREYRLFCDAMSRHTHVLMVDWSEFGSVSGVWSEAVDSWRRSPHSRFQKNLMKW